MRYKLLGRSGLRVSELCLGTMTFGEDWGWGSDKAGSRKVYDAFREAGGNFVDTANLYTNGTSETFLGEFLEGHRDEVVLATKYTNSAPGNNANAGGNQRKTMMRAVEASLKRLRTDYIDLYWMHIWDQMTPVEEVMRGFDDLIRQGKILYCGISDAPAWWVAQANTLATLRGWSSFVGLQIEYSLLERTVERELVPMASAFGLTVTAWSPLAGGVLTGKYKDDKEAKNGRFSTGGTKQNMPDPDKVERILPVLKATAKELGYSQAQIALAWLRHRNVPVIPIIGARKPEQLKDNMVCVDVHLDGKQIARLDDASSIELGFPNDFYAKDMVKTFVYGGMRGSIDAVTELTS